MTDEFTIEKITQDDKEEVLELSSHIWEGHDYIPDVFDEWIRDGGFYCAKLDGKIIAVDKFTEQGNGVIWLEGLRVHPDYQGKGYASKMVNGLMDIVEEHDHSALRFLTTARKEPVKKMAGDHGFEIMQVYKYLLIDEERLKEFDEIDLPKIEHVDQIELDKIMDFIVSSEEYDDNKEQYMAHWTTYDITEELIKDEIGKGNCYLIKDDEKIDSIIFFYYYEAYDTLSIACVGGNKEGIIKLMKKGINLCKENNYSSFTIKTASKKIIDCAKEAGMEPSDHYDVLLFEKVN
ncbi:MAG: GNAT family N-acetyltransferase [Thermoplasmata archaeon]